MNRNNLLVEAKKINRIKIKILDHQTNVPLNCQVKLSKKKCIKYLDNLYKEKKILEHGLVVGKELAYVLSGGKTNLQNECVN